MITMNVSIPDSMKLWIEQRARSGRYANASDYVGHMIRSDPQRTEKLAARADPIVSGDQDLLVLGSYRDIPIDTAAEALCRPRRRNSKGRSAPNYSTLNTAASMIKQLAEASPRTKPWPA